MTIELLKEHNELLIDALDHISRVARGSRTRSRRDGWIEARAESAISLDDKWRDLDLPKHTKDCSPRRVKWLEDRIKELEIINNTMEK